MSTDGKKKIIIADDEPDIVEFLKFRLEYHGFDVITAGDGQEAMQKIKAERPDLAILDMRMPGLTGCQVSSQVKHEKELQGITTIILSASIRQSAQGVIPPDNCTADSYLPKPYEFEMLLNEIKRLLPI